MVAAVGRLGTHRGRALSATIPAMFLAVLAASSPIQGQLVRGHLLADGTRGPVRDATITLKKVPDIRLGRVSTDPTGFFQLSVPGSGRFYLEAARLGYATTRSQELEIEGQDTVTVEFLIHTEIILLDPLVVIGQSSRGRSAFYTRMEEGGKGVYFTPQMVDSINPRHPADVLWGADKTFLIWRQGQRKPVPSIRTLKGNGCLHYMLNRLEIDPRFWGGLWENSPLEFLQGQDIVAVEYYRHISEVPGELLAFASKSGMCGLVIFWTRAGW